MASGETEESLDRRRSRRCGHLFAEKSTVGAPMLGGDGGAQQVLNHPAGNISVGTLDDAGLPLNRPKAVCTACRVASAIAI